jgi:hypothetical protein
VLLQQAMKMAALPAVDAESGSDETDASRA